MEYRREDGSRIRLQGLTPLPDALAVVALLKGDMQNFWSAMQASSYPTQLFSGLLSQPIHALYEQARGRVSTEYLGNEVVQFLNRLIPGQGLLAAFEAILDPAARRGLGANVPGVSLTAERVIDPTTGKVKEPRQIVPGIGAVPSTGGLGFPGMPREINPVEQALLDHGLGNYRPRRAPLAHYTTEEVPKELRLRFEVLRGELVEKNVSRVLNRQKFTEQPFDKRREELQEALSDATKVAKAQVRREEIARGGPRRKPGRIGTIFERRMPRSLRDLVEEEETGRLQTRQRY